MTDTTTAVAAASTAGACTGSNEILYRGPITPNISVSSGVTPYLTTASVAQEN